MRLRTGKASKNFSRFFLLGLCNSLLPGKSQLLTPEAAVRIGLENNHSLSLARDQTSIAENNRRAGIGPFLPELSASAGHTGDFEGGAARTSVGASLGLLIFDGFRSYNTYNRLQAQEISARLSEQAAIEATWQAILDGYFGIVQQRQRLSALEELLEVSRERARLAAARAELGAGTRLEELQSLADLNADSSALFSQQTALHNAKIQLNQLLARDPITSFEVIDTIPLAENLPLETWRMNLTEKNSDIARARAEKEAAALSVKEARGGHLPRVSGNISYSAQPEALNPEAPAFSNTGGPSYGINLSMPLFDRLNTQRNVGNARLGLRQGETRLVQQQESVRADFERAAQSYATGLRQVDLEARNLEVVRMQAEAAREVFRAGASTSLEFRAAQQRLLDARSRLAAARQSTKSSELSLQRLSGRLIVEAPQNKSPL